MVIETRTHNINNVVVTSTDIRIIANEIEKSAREYISPRVKMIVQDTFRKFAYNELKSSKLKSEYKSDLVEEESRCYCRLRSDSVNYYSRNMSVLNSDYLDNEFISAVSIGFNSSYGNASIDFSLNHTISGYESVLNSLTVSGDDNLWVNGVFERIKKKINLLEKQEIRPKKYSVILKLILSSIIGYLFMFAAIHIIVKLGVYNFSEKTESPVWYYYVLAIVWLAFLGGIPADIIVSNFVKLWPNVELRTGKDYMQLAKKRRIMLGVIIGTIIFPIFMEIIF